MTRRPYTFAFVVVAVAAAAVIACRIVFYLSRHGRIGHDDKGGPIQRRIFLQARRRKDVDNERHDGRHEHRGCLPRVRANRAGAAGREHVHRRKGERWDACKGRAHYDRAENYLLLRCN